MGSRSRNESSFFIGQLHHTLSRQLKQFLYLLFHFRRSVKLVIEPDESDDPFLSGSFQRCGQQRLVLTVGFPDLTLHPIAFHRTLETFLGNTDQDIGRTGGIYPLVLQSLPIISQKGYIPMKIYVLHGYTDGLTDPIVSTDYEEVYAAMKAAYENALDGVEQEDSDREYSFLEGWSATAVVHGDWMEWQIAELELKVPEEQPTPSV